jgi:hypothetical protein
MRRVICALTAAIAIGACEPPIHGEHRPIRAPEDMRAPTPASKRAEIEAQLSPIDLAEFRRVADERDRASEITKAQQAVIIPGGFDCSPISGICVEVSAKPYECAHYYSAAYKKCDLLSENVDASQQSIPLGCWAHQYNQLISPTSGMQRYWIPLGYGAAGEYGLCFEIDTYQGRYRDGLFMAGIASLSSFRDAYNVLYGVELHNRVQILARSPYNGTGSGWEYNDWLGKSTNGIFPLEHEWIRIQPIAPNQWISSLTAVSDPPWM